MNAQLKKFVEENYPCPGTALDLGCGDGIDINGLRSMGWKCDGVDLKTGTDLNVPYLSPNHPYDLVYSNFVIHKLTNPKSMSITIEHNLAASGYFFVQTFHDTDQYARKSFSPRELIKTLESARLKVIDTAILAVDEGAPDYHHHIVLQVIGKKK